MDMSGDSPRVMSVAGSVTETRTLPTDSIGDAPDAPRVASLVPSEESPSSLSAPVVDELELSVERAATNQFLLKLLVITSTPAMAHIWLVMCIVFLAIDTPFRCEIDEIEYGPFTSEDKVNLTQAATSPDQCFNLNLDYQRLEEFNFYQAIKYITRERDELHVGYVPCRKFYFENPDRSIISTFSLVCDRKVHLYQFEVTAFMGMAIGAPLTGCFSDQFGRRVVFMSSIILFVLMFPLPVIVSQFWSLLLSQFLCGMASSGMLFTGYIILIEWSRCTCRTVMGILFHVSLAVGLILVSLLAYCVQNWRYFQMAVSFPTIFLIVNIFFVKESPRWMISQGLREETWKVLENIDPILRPSEGDPTKPANKPEELTRTCLYYAKTFYGHDELRYRLLICIGGWLFAVMLYYYLLLGSTTYDDGLMYLYVGVCGLIDLVAYALSLLVLKGNVLCTSGFKPVVTVVLCSTGVSVVGLSLMPFSVKFVIFLVSIFVRLGISSALAMMMVHTMQLFPTKGRNTAMGICALVSYLLGIVIPFLIMLHVQINIVAASFIYWGGTAICGCLLLFLPRSYHNFELSDTVDDINREVRNKISVECKNFNRCS